MTLSSSNSLARQTRDAEPLPVPGGSAVCAPSPFKPAIDTAANYLVTRLPRARASDTVHALLASLPGHRYDSVDAVYVLDDKERLIGIVPLPDLLTHSGGERLGDLLTPVLHSVSPATDQEEVVSLAARHRLPSVPVVDGKGCLVGAVPGPALVQILNHEHAEDVHRLAGIVAPDPRATSALEASVGRRVTARLPWLMIGLVGSVGPTLVMARFENSLRSNIVIAFFVPAIVYLADAVGTQTEAVTVRYLSLGRRPLSRLLAGEAATGLLIGVSMGVLIFPAVYVWTGRARVSAAVALAVVAASGCAAATGLMFPWLLSRAGKDPAFGSGPVATIVQDIVSLLIYFALVVLLVG